MTLLLVDFADVVFAVDSIPAIFAVTQEPFIVFTSNAFAILGLRSLYFAIAGLMMMFKYIKLSLIFILGFVGVKMMLHHHVEIPHAISLGVIVGFLAIGILASLWSTRREQRIAAASRRRAAAWRLLTRSAGLAGVRDADGARDRPRHRQHHLHLDPGRPAAASEQQPRGRTIGLALAMLHAHPAAAVDHLGDGPAGRRCSRSPRVGVSGRDLILIGGGLFLLAKSTLEIHTAWKARRSIAQARGARDVHSA